MFLPIANVFVETIKYSHSAFVVAVLLISFFDPELLAFLLGAFCAATTAEAKDNCLRGNDKPSSLERNGCLCLFTRKADDR
jgi:hypothetical protein